MPDWSHVPTAWRFVGGRKRYNAVRQFAAEDRRRRLVDLYCRLDKKGEHVTQRQLAALLGVSESTVSRDVALYSDVFGWRFKISMGRTLGRL